MTASYDPTKSIDSAPRVYTSDALDVEWLGKDIAQCQPLTIGAYYRLQESEMVRFNLRYWKFLDGKKHDTKDGKARPFDGAADYDEPLADDICIERSDLLCLAFWSAVRKQAAGLSDAENYAVKLLSYLCNKKLHAELHEEVEFSAQWVATQGWCLLHPTWQTQIGRKEMTITLEQIQQWAAGADPAQAQGAQAWLSAVMDPSQEEAAVAQAQRIFASLVGMRLDPLTAAPTVRAGAWRAKEFGLQKRIKELAFGEVGEHPHGQRTAGVRS